MNMFELLVVLNVENRTVELTGLACAKEFDNIFAHLLTVVESQRICHPVTQNSMIMHEI